MRGGRRTDMTGEQSATVLDLLADEVARSILAALEEPMTTQELAATCDIPRSTAYRKVDRLQEAGLVTDRIRVSPDGRHPHLYTRAASEVHLQVTLEDVSVELEPVDDAPEARSNEAMTN